LNAVLTYPKFPDTFWSFKRALEFVGKKTSLAFGNTALPVPLHGKDNIDRQRRESPAAVAAGD